MQRQHNEKEKLDISEDLKLINPKQNKNELVSTIILEGLEVIPEVWVYDQCIQSRFLHLKLVETLFQ